MRTVLQIEQELFDASCFINCGGEYCTKEGQAKCKTWNKAEKLQDELEKARKGLEYKRNNPQQKFKTDRDYEKAILIKQEEEGFYDV